MARLFSAVSDRVSRLGAILSASTGPFTIAVCFKPTSLGAGTGYVLHSANSNGISNWGIQWNSSTTSISLQQTGGGTFTTSSGITIASAADYSWVAWRKTGSGAGAWDKFLAGVRTSINGSINTSLPSLASTPSTYIGSENLFATGITSAFRGTIAEVAVWTSALTDQQILDIANGTMADQIAKGTLTLYVPLRGGYSTAAEPNYASSTPFASSVIYTVSGTSTATHPDDSGFAYPVPTVGVWEPAYALDLGVSTPRRSATVDLYEDAAVDTLGAAYPKTLVNAESIAVRHELSSAQYGVDIPSTATVIIANPELTVPPAIEGLTLWLKADAIQSLADGDSVASWSDLSRGAYSAVQGTGSLKPTYQSDSGSTQNGLPVVRFDGSNDYLSVSNFAISATMTIFVAGKFTNANPMLIEHGTNARLSDGFFFSGNGGGGNYAMTTRRTALRDVAGTTNWMGNSFAIASGTAANSKTQIWKNGTSILKDTGTGQTNSTLSQTLYIGARAGSSFFSSGDFGEIIIYDRQLSDAERRQIEIYLAAKWGVTLDSGMPEIYSPGYDYRGTAARLRRYDRVSREVMTELQGVILDQQFPPGQAVFTIGSQDDGILSTLIPTQVITVDDAPSAGDLGAPYPVAFGTSYMSPPAIGQDVYTDVGGHDFALTRTLDADGATMHVSVDGVYYDNDGQPGLEQAAGWDAIQGSATRSSATTFTITGDYSLRYAAGMLCRVVTNASTGVWDYATITAVSYSAPNTTITVDQSIITTTINTGGNIARISAAPTAGGTGYKVGDLLTITTGGGLGTVRVMKATAGVVTELALVSPGLSYSTGSGASTTGGSGTGCTVNIQEICRGQIASDFIVESSRYALSGEGIQTLRTFDLPQSNPVVKLTNAEYNTHGDVAWQILASGTWGANQTVNSDSINTAYDVLDAAGLSAACNWTLGGDKQQISVQDALNQLLAIRGGRAWKNYAGEWEIEYDTIPAASTITLGYGDGVYNNVISGALQRMPLGQAVSILRLRYGPPIKMKRVDGVPTWMPVNGYLYSVKAVLDTATSHEEVIVLPQITTYIHAARVLSYIGKRRRAEDNKQFPCTAGYEARRLQIGKLVRVSSPLHGVHEDMRVRTMTRRLTTFDVECVGYDPAAYTYDASFISADSVDTAATATTNNGGDDVSALRMTEGDGANLVLNADFSVPARKSTVLANTIPAWGTSASSISSLATTSDYRCIGRSYLTIVVSGVSPTPNIYTTRSFDQYGYGELSFPTEPFKVYVGSIYADSESGWKFNLSFFSAVSTSISTLSPTVRVDPNDKNSFGWKRYYFQCRAADPSVIGATMEIEFTAAGTYKFEAAQFEQATRGGGRPTKWKRHTTWGVDPAVLQPGTLTIRRTGDAQGGSSFINLDVTVSGLSGATVTSTGAIPAGAFVWGVTARVTTLITGATSWKLGDGTTNDQWGTGLGVALNTKTDSDAFKATWVPTYYKTAQNIVLTSTGGNFTAGAVRLTIHYVSLIGATS